MYTSLLISIKLDDLRKLAEDIDLLAHTRATLIPTVKSELVEQLNTHFIEYPDSFHETKMKYFSVHGQPTHREDLTLATNSETGETVVLLRDNYPDIPYTPVPDDLEVYEEVHQDIEETYFQPTGNFSLIKHEDVIDEEFGMKTIYVPLGSTTFISHHDLALLNEKPYYLVKYTCKFDKVQKESLFSTYLKACLYLRYVLDEVDESQIVMLTLDEDEYIE